MMVSSRFFFFAFVAIAPLVSIAQDSTQMKTSGDTLKPKLLRAATVTRIAPLLQHQIDRITLNVDRQVTAAGTNTLELIRLLPGVQVSPEGLISLNGRAGVNVLIDGKPTYLSAEDLANLLGNLPSAEVQKLELMTNPPAKFDAQGTGGLINIIRKRTHAAGFNGTATGTIGEGNYPRYTGSVLLNYATGKWNFYLNESYNSIKTRGGRTVTADIFNGPQLLSQQLSTTGDVTVNRANNSTAGIDWNLSKRTTLSFNGTLGFRAYHDLTHSTMVVLDDKSSITGNTGFSALNTDHPFNYTTGLQLIHRLDSAGQEWSADADYSEFHYRPGQLNNTMNTGPAGNFESESDVFLAQTRRLQIAGARADYVHPWPGKGKWEAGWKSSYVRTVNTSSDSSDNINTENINAAYLNANRQYKKLALQAGLRVEESVMKGRQLYTDHSKVRQNYFQLFPTLFADYKMDADNSFNLQLGRRIDRADYHELVPFRRPLTPTLFFMGNPYLRPNVTWHGEMTWAWRNAVFVNFGYDIDKDYVRTLPYLDANDSTTTRIPTNISGAHSWSLSLSYNHAVTKWWTSNTTATLYQNSFTGNAGGYSLNNTGIVSLDLACNNSLTFDGGLSGEIDFETETKRQFVQSSFGGYSVLSFGLRQQLAGKKATLSLNAHNVLQSEGRSTVDRYQNLYQYTDLFFYTRYVTLTMSWRFGSGKGARANLKSGSADEQHRAGN